ncbi:MAG: hypothetical protein M1533_01425 [Candidatus Thermoplasmatota archaeon]|jgi:predicted transcriptional regulator|nr:hypothetical protein [Candidatus Thermoplasmatota archaeon]MCL5793838.1 hypothetical protein [Candidatus Thermoplasmatota archaeon]
MGSINQLMKNRASCGDLLECLFDLTSTDISLFMALSQDKQSDLDTIAASVGKSRSTAFRSLQKLVCLGLAIKETETIGSGGYFHTYSRVKSDSVRRIIQLRAMDISSKIEKILETIDSDLSEVV